MNHTLEETAVLDFLKATQKQIAETNGTDMSNYKLVGKKHFACNLMHVGRDVDIPVVINRPEEGHSVRCMKD